MVDCLLALGVTWEVVGRWAGEWGGMVFVVGLSGFVTSEV